MADIPSSIIQPINPPTIAGPDPNAPQYSQTPALDALQDAYQKGLVGVSDIMKLAEQGSELGKTEAVNKADVQAAKLRLGVQPAIAAQETAEAQSKTAQIPSAQAAAIAENQQRTELTPIQTAAIKGDTQPAADWGGMIAAAHSMDPDGSQQLTTTLNSWRQNGLGPVPIDPDTGHPDYGRMKQMESWLGQMHLRAASMGAMGPLGEGIFKEAVRKQVVDQIFDPSTGWLKPGAFQAIESAPEPPDAELQGKLIQHIRQASDTSPLINQALGIVNDMKMKAVGAGYNEGSVTGTALARVGAFFKNSAQTEKFAAQRDLEMNLAARISDTIRSLAGSGNRVMQAEVNPDTGLFYKQMPGLNSPVSVWNDWLTYFQQKMGEAAKDSQSQMTVAQASKYNDLVETATTPPNVPAGAKFLPGSPGNPNPGASAPTTGIVPGGNTATAGTQDSPFETKAQSKAGQWYKYGGKIWYNSGQ